LTALLNVHSCFSFGEAVSSPRRLLEVAAGHGFSHVALTDTTCVGGVVELHQAARAQGLGAIIGASLPVTHDDETHPLLVFARNRQAYARLNRLITRVRDGEPLGLGDLRCEPLTVLTGPRASRLGQMLEADDALAARAWLEVLRRTFSARVFMQLFHDQHQGDARRVRLAYQFALDAGLEPVAAPEVRYASEDQWMVHDALTCARLGIDLDQPHPSRPTNPAQAIQTPEHYASRFPFPDALENTERLARRLSFTLLPERLVPPRASIPRGFTARSHLEWRCRAALSERYPPAQRRQAGARLEHELALIRQHGFEAFFLVAAEVMDYCRDRGILAAGRGSAAGSIVCYLLGVTVTDPLAHDLLFERFLHGGKATMPDIDIDLSSARRREVIAWVEERFGADGGTGARHGGCEAMVANRITYRLPSAIEDLARALGVPPAQGLELSRALGRDYRGLRPHRARDAQVVFDEVLGDAPVKQVMLDVLERMDRGHVRHLAPHSGGVVLSRFPLDQYSPLETSSGGIRMIQFDKDDTEALGLIKLDLLGLRMLSAIENALEEIERTEGVRLDPYRLPDHPKVWWRIGRGDTLGIFQIESPGQINLSARNKPRSLVELAHQIALFRPGPIQSNTVHPYLRRRWGREPIQYLHPSLEPILSVTFGVILFQEQVLRVCHHFAGLDWVRADRYRKKLSTWETEDDLTELRAEFVAGARRTVNASEEVAGEVFAMCAAFRGYGFTESHAFAFAQHAYASAYLREFYLAEYSCGLLNEAPGMYARQTLAQEAIRQGVRLLPLDVNASPAQFGPGRSPPCRNRVKAVRFGLNGVASLDEETPARIALERLRGPFSGLADFHGRVRLKRNELEALARAGAFDGLMPRREAIYQARVLEHSLPPGEPALFAPGVATPALPAPSD
jgi:error-prone DNA polymerase